MSPRGNRERASCPRGERNGKVSVDCGESEWEPDLSVAITDWNERGGDGSPIARIPLTAKRLKTTNKTGICFGIASVEIKGNSWNATSYLWCRELGATMLGRGMHTEYVTF